MTTTVEPNSLLDGKFLEGACVWTVDAVDGSCSLESRLLAGASVIETDVSSKVPHLVRQVVQLGIPVAEKSLMGKDLGGTGDSLQRAIAIPFFCESQMTAVLTLLCGTSEDSRGVVESWQPVGNYAELQMAAGCYVGLDRFENVSRFVRVGYGQGLPGLVWKQQQPIVHESLSSHTGFLRAAGASAAELEAGIGFPIVSTDFVASILLISSEKSPLFKGAEHWSADESGVAIEHRYGFGDGQRLGLDSNPMVEDVYRKQAPVISVDRSFFAARREEEFESMSIGAALGIPVVGSDKAHVLMIYL